MHLSAWLGVGDGLSPSEEKDKALLREMYEEWPWFREIISLISMLISKTDFSITQHYDDLLVDPELMSLGDEVREKLVQTRRAVIDISGRCQSMLGFSFSASLIVHNHLGNRANRNLRSACPTHEG